MTTLERFAVDIKRADKGQYHDKGIDYGKGAYMPNMRPAVQNDPAEQKILRPGLRRRGPATAPVNMGN